MNVDQPARSFAWWPRVGNPPLQPHTPTQHVTPVLALRRCLCLSSGSLLVWSGGLALSLGLEGGLEQVGGWVCLCLGVWRNAGLGLAFVLVNPVPLSKSLGLYGIYTRLPHKQFWLFSICSLIRINWEGRRDRVKERGGWLGTVHTRRREGHWSHTAIQTNASHGLRSVFTPVQHHNIFPGMSSARCGNFSTCFSCH